MSDISLSQLLEAGVPPMRCLTELHMANQQNLEYIANLPSIIQVRNHKSHLRKIDTSKVENVNDLRTILS